MTYFYRSFFLQILRSTYNGSHPFFLDTLHACKRQLFWNIPECLQEHRTVFSWQSLITQIDSQKNLETTGLMLTERNQPQTILKVTFHQAMSHYSKTFKLFMRKKVPTLITVGPSPAHGTGAIICVQWQNLTCPSILTRIRIAKVIFWKWSKIINFPHFSTQNNSDTVVSEPVKRGKQSLQMNCAVGTNTLRSVTELDMFLYFDTDQDFKGHFLKWNDITNFTHFSTQKKKKIVTLW